MDVLARDVASDWRTWTADAVCLGEPLETLFAEQYNAHTPTTVPGSSAPAARCSRRVARSTTTPSVTFRPATYSDSLLTRRRPNECVDDNPGDSLGDSRVVLLCSVWSWVFPVHSFYL
jgi:hypothetical protein